MPGFTLISQWHNGSHWSGTTWRWCSPSSVLRSLKDWSLQDASTKLLTRSASAFKSNWIRAMLFRLYFILLFNPLVMGARPSSSWMLASCAVPILKSHRKPFLWDWNDAIMPLALGIQKESFLLHCFLLAACFSGRGFTLFLLDWYPYGFSYVVIGSFIHYFDVDVISLEFSPRQCDCLQLEIILIAFSNVSFLRFNRHKNKWQ